MAGGRKKPVAPSSGLFDVSDELKTAPCVPALRQAVRAWRAGGYKGTTATTRRLLRFWFETSHRTESRTLFTFHPAQREAIETLIFVWEYERVRDPQSLLERYASDLKGVPLPTVNDWARYALKMATGSGKTKVAALVIAWQFLNAARESAGVASAYARTAVVLAPNVIVFERLRTDFGAGRIFRTDPIIPREWLDDWDFDVVERGDGIRGESALMLFLTNIQQLYDGADAKQTEPDAMRAVLDPPVRLPKLDLSDPRERIALRDGPLLVINDEGHHVWPESEWDMVIASMHARTPIALQVDLSATPRLPKTGTLFPWIVYDYPLKQAILDGVVKRPIRGVTKFAEVNSQHASVRYEGFLIAGVERWKEYRTQLAPLSRKPLLFVMLNDTEEAEEVAYWLAQRYPTEFGGDRLLVIHTNKQGDITKADLDKARRAAREVDEESSPVNAIVSVMMLREGWDVANVTVVLGLRPFTSKTNILPEQAIGRGLRLMFRGTATGYSERVDIIGTPKFMEFVDELEKIEKIKLGDFEVGKDKLKILTIAPDPTRSALDLSLPLLSPVLVRKRSLAEEIAALDVMAFDLPPVVIHVGALPPPQRFSYEGRDIITNDKEFEREYAVPEPQTAQEVIGYYARRIGERLYLPAQFAAIATKVRDFFAHRVFGHTVDLESPQVLRAISQPLARFVTEKVFVQALARVAVAARDPHLLEEGRLLSSCAPFPWSGEVVETRHSVFPLAPCDNKFEVTFARWLDGCEGVVAWAKLPMRFAFSIEYLDDDYSLRNYHPDWVARSTDGTMLLLETKGQESVEVASKDRAARVWCANATSLTGQPWRYLKVLQKGFEKHQIARLDELFVLFDQPAAGGLLGKATVVHDPLASLPAQDRVLLEQVYGLVAEGKARKAVSRIFEGIDQHLLAETFGACGKLLDVVDLQRLEPTTALAFLSITNIARKHIGSRVAFLDRVEKYLLTKRDPDYVARLLEGLR